jgi:hypothetical protein
MNASANMPVPGLSPVRFPLEAGAAIVARVVAITLGAVFALVGLVGFAKPDLLHSHLSAAHNWIHIVSGALALFLGLVGTLGAVRAFNLVFGAVYGLLGVVGFLIGQPGNATVGDIASDNRLWALIPGVLELGSMDHTIHVVTGAIFLLGGIAGYLARPPASDRGN